jgi:hypothetical protein
VAVGWTGAVVGAGAGERVTVTGVAALSGLVVAAGDALNPDGVASSPPQDRPNDAARSKVATVRNFFMCEL